MLILKVLFLFLIVLIAGCNSTESPKKVLDQPEMIDFGNYKVSKSEFEKDKEILMNYSFSLSKKRLLLNSVNKLMLTIELEGYYPGEVTIKKWPVVTGSTVDWSSKHSSSSLKVSVGKRIHKVVYRWDLKTNNQIGSFKIGSALIEHHNQIYKTNEIIYEIEGGEKSLKLHKT